jgi:DNA-binding PadR family transcriptional regulator
LVLFALLPNGFSNADLRQRLAALLGRRVSAGSMTYDLRRLRLHGLIQRIPRTHRYQVTPTGLRYALFLTRVYDRVLRPGLVVISLEAPHPDPALRDAFARLHTQIDAFIQRERLVA